MFQSLRRGSPFYILDKNEPKLSIGEVDSVVPSIPQYGTTYQNGIITPPKSMVDVKVRVNGEIIKLESLPSDLVIADFGSNGMVVSESREAIMSEIEGFKCLSERTLNDMDKHKHIVAECVTMLSALNPHLAQEVEQAKEIEGLKSELADIKGMLAKALKSSSKV